ncbi:MAG: hypothetical protein ACPG21_01345 [Crocinitomicaceae bacterium]
MIEKIRALLFFGLALSVIGCKKEGPLSPTKGIYRGVFSKISDANDTLATGIAFIAINDADSSFTMQGDTLSNAPISCNGYFSIIDENYMEFNNNAVLGVFEDPYYILDTVYRYAFLDSTFTLRLDLPRRSYDFNLRRF